ncbi:MAG: RnfABCDGE type electron transport complex subunit D [Alphaproteobacteria bacterium]|nr:RnfABCDGE type electron transport complex subunit D [Alphaproteobacteria bacterium]
MISTHDISGPYAHQKTSIRRTMALVMVALLPATLFDLWVFGWPAINLLVLTLAASVAAEAGCLSLAGKRLPLFLGDGSVVLTGWLLAMSLPPWAPWWIAVLGGVVAVVLGKHVFGGLGQNVFNPAMVGRVALLISFPLPMTMYVAPRPLFGAGSPGFVEGLSITFGGWDYDALSAASTLGHVKTELARGVALDQAMGGTDLMALVMGTVPGSMGETSAALLLLGGLFLIARRVISWHIPVSMLGALFALATLMHWVDPARFPGGFYHLVTGAAVLGAFFIATDLVTSPVTPPGQLVYGAGIGILTYVIRTWAGFPEGIAFAVLLMNAMTPLIDRWVRPRVYGRTLRGEPLQPRRKA